MGSPGSRQPTLHTVGLRALGGTYSRDITWPSLMDVKAVWHWTWETVGHPGSNAVGGVFRPPRTTVESIRANAPTFLSRGCALGPQVSPWRPSLTSLYREASVGHREGETCPMSAQAGARSTSWSWPPRRSPQLLRVLWLSLPAGRGTQTRSDFRFLSWAIGVIQTPVISPSEAKWRCPRC